MNSGKDPSIFLRHILAAISDIQEYTARMPHDAFLEDRKTQAAVNDSGLKAQACLVSFRLLHARGLTPC